MKELWYCEDHDTWSDKPQEYTQGRANGTGAEVTLTFRKGKQLKLADLIDADSVIQHLDNACNSDDICGLEDDPMFASGVPEEKVKELQSFLETWCNSIDYPYWEDDGEGDEITVTAKPAKE